MEQNRKSRNKPTTIWPINLQQNKEEYPMRKGQTFQQCQENWTATGKKKKLNHFFTLYARKNSKWVKDLKP